MGWRLSGRSRPQIWSPFVRGRFVSCDSSISGSVERTVGGGSWPVVSPVMHVVVRLEESHSEALRMIAPFPWKIFPSSWWASTPVGGSESIYVKGGGVSCCSWPSGLDERGRFRGPGRPAALRSGKIPTRGSGPFGVGIAGICWRGRPRPRWGLEACTKRGASRFSSGGRSSESVDLSIPLSVLTGASEFLMIASRVDMD